MDRINSEGTIIIDGKRMFTDGDPEAENPIEATTITAEFLNGIQEEICGFVEAQDIKLNNDKHSGLSLAVEKMIDKKIKPLNEQIEKIWNIIGQHTNAR